MPQGVGVVSSFAASLLLVKQQEGHLPCKNLGVDLTWNNSGKHALNQHQVHVCIALVSVKIVLLKVKHCILNIYRQNCVLVV